MPAITVLYEDHRSHRQGFGLHALVKACVFDVVDGERHRVEGALGDYRPLNGVQNVFRACREDFDLIAADGRSVVAVVDNDAIRHHVKVPKTAADADVERAIKKGCSAPERLFVVLLEQNTESVLEAAAACDPAHDRERMERAVRRKDLLERDAILMEVARERARPLRDCILGKMPSLKGLVDLLVGKVRPGEDAKKAATPPVSPRSPGRKQRKPRR